VDLADLNGDGMLDLVTGGAFNDVLRASMGNGNGTFQTAQTVANFAIDGHSAEDVHQAVGDINGDGTLDLAVTYNVWYGNDEIGIAYPEGHVQALLGNGDGTFAAGDHYPIGPGYIGRDVLADFDGDGKLDIVTGGYFDGNVALLLGNGDGTFDAPELSPAGSVHGEPYDIAVADLDGNGNLDIATANPGWNTMSVLLHGATALPSLRTSDATASEGNTGTQAVAFTVTLSAASSQPVTVAYATANGSAIAGSDYQAQTGTLSFAPGEISKTISVAVNGDRVGELNETFFVNLGNPINATIADGLGSGTILDDEPRVSITDVTKKEGRSGATYFYFTVTLSAAYDQAVKVSFFTADGTANASQGDYAARAGTLTFRPGQTTKTIRIAVKGDRKVEANETFFIDLTGVTDNMFFTKNRGIGTILNDD
jgi:hypothetical protein